MFKLPHQQDTEPGAWPPCLLCKMVCFLKCVLLFRSTCVGFRRQHLEAFSTSGKRIRGCPSLGPGEFIGGECFNEVQKVGEIACHQPLKGPG